MTDFDGFRRILFWKSQPRRLDDTLRTLKIRSKNKPAPAGGISGKYPLLVTRSVYIYILTNYNYTHAEIRVFIGGVGYVYTDASPYAHILSVHLERVYIYDVCTYAINTKICDPSFSLYFSFLQATSHKLCTECLPRPNPQRKA